MNPTMRIFFEHMLTQNISFILFLGILLPVISGVTIKQSFTSGLKHCIAILFSTMAAVVLFAAMPNVPAYIDPAMIFLLTMFATKGLHAWGELQGEWAGIPKTVLAFVPYAGSMLYFRTENLSGLSAVSAAAGMAAGFYLAFLVSAALIEQIYLSEAAPPFRRIGVLFFALALFALALAGFQFF